MEDNDLAPEARRTKRFARGLVLEGGGAKGAFQFGCLFALHEYEENRGRGKLFDAVAGTSVGALNAALWSTKQMEWGRQFWKEISLDKVYPLRKPRRLYIPLAISYGLTKRTSDWVRRRPHTFFMAGITIAWCIVCSVIGLSLYFLINAVALLLGHGINFSGLLQISAGLLVAVPLVFVSVIEYWGVSALTAEQLRTTLTERLDHVGASFEIPTFATIAIAEQIYDPDKLNYASTGIPQSFPIQIPQPTKHYVPRYERLTEPTADNVRKLLASAALPYGIVPAVRNAVDGGMADNIPVYPLVSIFPCERILIVRAGVGSIAAGVCARTWSAIDRLFRLVRYDANSAHSASPKAQARVPGEILKRHETLGQVEPLRAPEYFPEMFVVSRDEEPRPLWGDFIGRTMNFNPAFTALQFDNGYKTPFHNAVASRLTRIMAAARTKKARAEETVAS